MHVGVALNAVLEARHVEVDQEPYRLSTQSRVGEDLGLVDRKQFSHGLQFDHNGVFYQQVDAVTDIEPDGPVDNRQLRLAKDVEVPSTKLKLKTSLVRRFQETGTEV